MVTRKFKGLRRVGHHASLFGSLRTTAAGNVALFFFFLVLLFVDFGSHRGFHFIPRSSHSVAEVGQNQQQASVDSAEVPLDGNDAPPLSDVSPARAQNKGEGTSLDDESRAVEGRDDWSAYEQKPDPDKIELAPLNTLLDDSDPLLSCCPKKRLYDAVCTCAPVLKKMVEMKLNLTSQIVKRIIDEEMDREPMNLVSRFYSDWKKNLEANPEATLGQKQIFCQETIVEQAQLEIEKTMDRRNKKLDMGVSEANLPWILQLDNIAHASKLETHRAKETSIACLAYIDVLEEENELKKQVEDKERQERRARRAAERQRERKKRRNKDLTKASSFNCEELRGKSEFRDYYKKICGEDGSRNGRAKIIGRNVIVT